MSPSPLLVISLCLIPLRSIDDAPRAAETLGGHELLRWRLLARSALRDGNEARAVELLAALITDEPRQHWVRTLLAIEAGKLGLRDAGKRSLLPSMDLGSLSPARRPTDEQELEGWAADRFPYVDASTLLDCANAAIRRGAIADSMLWLDRAQLITAATQPAFFDLAFSLALAIERSDRESPEALALLERLTERPWRPSAELYQVERLLRALLRFPPPTQTQALCTRLLEICPTGRFGLAVLLRGVLAQAYSSDQSPSRRLREFVRQCHDPLDRAALLHRVATPLLLSEDSRAEGLALLREAAAIAPDSALLRTISEDLLGQLCRREGTDAEILGLVREQFRRPGAYWEELLPGFDALLDALLASGRTELVGGILAELTHLPPDHPFQVRILQLRAVLEDDPERARALYASCLTPTELGFRFVDPPQLAALAALADLLERTGEPGLAAEHLALALALSPAPERHRPESFEPFARLVRLRLVAGEDPVPVARDLLLLLDRGRLLDDSPQLRILGHLCAPLLADPGRGALLDELRAQRRECLAGNGAAHGLARPQLDFLGELEELVTAGDPELFEQLHLALQGHGWSDAEVYDLVATTLDRSVPSLTRRVLAIAQQTSPADGSARFSAPFPESLGAPLLELLAATRRGDQIATLCAVLESTPREGALGALWEQFFRIDGPARNAIARTLGIYLQDLAPAEIAQQARLHPRCFRELATGDLVCLELCATLQPQATVDALLQYLSTSTEDELRIAAVRKLAHHDASAAAQLLARLARSPEEPLQELAHECLRRVGRLLPESELPGIEEALRLEIGSESAARD